MPLRFRRGVVSEVPRVCASLTRWPVGLPIDTINIKEYVAIAVVVMLSVDVGACGTEIR